MTKQSTFGTAANSGMLIFALIGCGEAAEDKRISISSDAPSIEGVYSDVAYNDESGDVYGTEVIIRRSGATYLASFRLSEGAPGRKSIVPLSVRGDTIEFTIPPDSGILVHGSIRQPTETNPARKVIGRVTRWGLRGVVEDWTDSLTLPRKEKPYFADSLPAGSS